MLASKSKNDRSKSTTIELRPDLKDLDFGDATAWLNRRIAHYDTSNVDYIRVGTKDCRGWYEIRRPKRTAPRAQTFVRGYQLTAHYRNGIEFPHDTHFTTGWTIEGSPGHRFRCYTVEDVSIATPGELLIVQVAMVCFRWLRHSKQVPVSQFGAATNNGSRCCAIAWLEDYRNRTRPGMGRRAAVLATRAKHAAAARERAQ
jgi:hypothetical protein